MPDICRRIIEKGLKVKWYLIGYGPDEDLITKRIEESSMQESVILLGKKENPYPFIKFCDYYVQPSRFEGKAVTVREAQFLCKPVIITDYSTSKSQLKDGYDGLIVPMKNEECAAKISTILQDGKQADSLSQNCSREDYTNAEEIKKIYKLII